MEGENFFSREKKFSPSLVFPSRKFGKEGGGGKFCPEDSLTEGYGGCAVDGQLVDFIIAESPFRSDDENDFFTGEGFRVYYGSGVSEHGGIGLGDQSGQFIFDEWFEAVAVKNLGIDGIAALFKGETDFPVDRLILQDRSLPVAFFNFS